MKVCASCEQEENLNDISLSVSLPQWLKQTNFVKNFVQSMNPIQKITKTTIYFISIYINYNKYIIVYIGN